MAINLTDFDKIWASTSPLTPYAFSENNYKQGWNFVGATPPARQMWDSYMKLSDEKSQWLYNNKLSLSGGTMTGTITAGTTDVLKSSANNSRVVLMGGTGYSSGASVILNGGDASVNAGTFQLLAQGNSSARTFLIGYPDGTLTWGGKNVERVNASGTNYIRYESGLQICWGNLSNVAMPYTLTYPQPFKSSPSVATDNGALYTSNWSATGCQLVRLSGSGNAYVGYIAIGYWK